MSEAERPGESFNQDGVYDTPLQEPSEFLRSYQGPARKVGLRQLLLGRTIKPARFRKTKNRNVYWQDWVRVTAATVGIVIFVDSYRLPLLLMCVIISTAITTALRRWLP